MSVRGAHRHIDSLQYYLFLFNATKHKQEAAAAIIQSSPGASVILTSVLLLRGPSHPKDKFRSNNSIRPRQLPSQTLPLRLSPIISMWTSYSLRQQHHSQIIWGKKKVLSSATFVCDRDHLHQYCVPHTPTIQTSRNGLFRFVLHTSLALKQRVLLPLLQATFDPAQTDGSATEQIIVQV